MSFEQISAQSDSEVLTKEGIEDWLKYVKVLKQERIRY